MLPWLRCTALVVEFLAALFVLIMSREESLTPPVRKPENAKARSESAPAAILVRLESARTTAILAPIAVGARLLLFFLGRRVPRLAPSLVTAVVLARYGLVMLRLHKARKLARKGKAALPTPAVASRPCTHTLADTVHQVTIGFTGMVCAAALEFVLIVA